MKTAAYIFIGLCALFLVGRVPLVVRASTNVLTNGDFSSGSTGWTILQSGGSGCSLSGLLATSYDWCIVSQQVNLVTAGYGAGELDAAPDITFSLARYQRGDKPNTKYFLEFKLLAGDGATVATSSLYGSQASSLTISSGYDTWATTTYTFSSYGSGVRYAYIKIGGDDGSPNWAGHYGPYFDNVSVTLASLGDTDPPTVSSLSPADDAIGIGATSTLEIDFNEAVATSTGGSITLYKAADDSVAEIFSMDSAAITAPSSTAIRITPSHTLESLEGYYVTISSDAIKDTSDNFYAGITASTTWNFTAADTEAPTLFNTSPSGEQPLGTTTLSLRVETNESAHCAYTRTSGAPYAAHTPFDATGGTVHTTTLSGFSNGLRYIYYVLCRDAALNQSTTDIIDFSIAQSPGGSKKYTSSASGARAIAASSNGSSSTQGSVSLSSPTIALTTSGVFGEDRKEAEDGGSMTYASDTSAQNPGGMILFPRDLTYGMEGTDVRSLQQFLNAHGSVLIAHGAGAPGEETEFFMERTRDALRRFQRTHGIEPSAGYFGPMTRGVIRREYGIE